MAKFNTMRDFFVDGTVIPATDVDQLKQEIKKNNDFKNSDLLKDVIEINNVLGVESHPKQGFLKVQMEKRPGEILNGFPGFSFHSKHFVSYNPNNLKLFVFVGKATIQVIKDKNKKDILTGVITESYLSIDANTRLITYTADHTI